MPRLVQSQLNCTTPNQGVDVSRKLNDFCKVMGGGFFYSKESRLFEIQACDLSVRAWCNYLYQTRTDHAATEVYVALY